MRKWLILLVLALLLAGAGWYFWSLGNLPKAAAAAVILSLDNEGVDLKLSGAGDWQRAKGGEKLQAGDAVRTGTGGAATLTFFDLSQVRLAPATELKIDTAEADPGKPLTVRLQLGTGRVWSRILRLFELDDTYAVATNSIVATVRGTAFDIAQAATGTVLSVSESAVEVSGQNAQAESASQPLVVSEGFTVAFDANGGVLKTQASDDDVMQSDWAVGNAQRDSAFVRRIQDATLARLGNLEIAQPDSLLDGLTQLSEKTHMALQPQRAPQLYAGYVERRLFAIKQLVERGKSGAAYNALTAMENSLTAKLSDVDAEKYRGLLRRALFDVSALMAQVGPSSPLYRMKQRLEDLQVSLVGKDDLEVAYTRLRTIDARLDESLMLINQSSLDEAKTALDAASQGLANVERDIDHLPDAASRDRVSALRGKLNVLKARENAYRVRLATAIEPPQSEIIQATSTAATTSTDMGLSAASGTAETMTENATTSFETIGLSAVPGNPSVGDKVQLKVKAIRADGTKVDVTARSKFVVTGPATANGPVVTPTAVGEVEVVATFEDGLDKFEAKMKLEAKAAAVSLKSLRLKASGPDSLAFGATSPVMATAVYSDGTTKDVTKSTTFTTSNLRLGFMTDNVFNAGREVAGQARVVGTYKEDGGTVTASLDFNIVAQ